MQIIINKVSDIFIKRGHSVDLTSVSYETLSDKHVTIIWLVNNKPKMLLPLRSNVMNTTS